MHVRVPTLPIFCLELPILEKLVYRKCTENTWGIELPQKLFTIQKKNFTTPKHSQLQPLTYIVNKMEDAECPSK